MRVITETSVIGEGVDGMRSLILGTAGHIDHGKTALVRALTGTDTDRLKEERERGITIELGFAELVGDDSTRFGVVDVPGHEAFVRAMVAGAAGMDVVLLVVAADEGVMPQTREHLSIVELLGVPSLVVALTKCDLVEEEWLELVHAEVADLLEPTPYAHARRIETSAAAGKGIDALVDALVEAAGRVDLDRRSDVTRLPLDRVFTIQGTGTVVTGTLWSGSLRVGALVRILPQSLDARVRSLEVHGREAEEAEAGERTAVALVGDGSDRNEIGRGSTIVSDSAWSPTSMLTAEVRMLPDTDWCLEHNQRVHLHLATAEVRARCVVLEDGPLGPGGRGWVQFRLEEPLVARARDRFVVRAYSPVTTIGGGVVAEPDPPKRRSLDGDVRAWLSALIGTEPRSAIRAALELAGWAGVTAHRLPLVTGLLPDEALATVDGCDGEGWLRIGERIFSASVRREVVRRIVGAVERAHSEDPLRPAIALSSIRSAIPAWAPAELADGAIAELVEAGRLVAEAGGVRRPDHEVRLTGEQEEVSRRFIDLFEAKGLSAPPVEELPSELRARPDFWPLLRHLEAADVIRSVADGLYVSARALDDAEARIRRELGGRTELGPADFRTALPVTRKHLIPLLNYFDGRGATVRQPSGRDVPG